MIRESCYRNSRKSSPRSPIALRALSTAGPAIHIGHDFRKSAKTSTPSTARLSTHCEDTSQVVATTRGEMLVRSPPGSVDIVCGASVAGKGFGGPRVRNFMPKSPWARRKSSLCRHRGLSTTPGGVHGLRVQSLVRSRKDLPTAREVCCIRFQHRWGEAPIDEEESLGKKSFHNVCVVRMSEGCHGKMHKSQK